MQRLASAAPAVVPGLPLTPDFLGCDVLTPPCLAPPVQAKQANPRWNPANATGRLPEGWAEFFAFHCACLAALQVRGCGHCWYELFCGMDFLACSASCTPPLHVRRGLVGQFAKLHALRLFPALGCQL